MHESWHRYDVSRVFEMTYQKKLTDAAEFCNKVNTVYGIHQSSF